MLCHPERILGFDILKEDPYGMTQKKNQEILLFHPERILVFDILKEDSYGMTKQVDECSYTLSSRICGILACDII